MQDVGHGREYSDFVEKATRSPGASPCLPRGSFFMKASRSRTGLRPISEEPVFGRVVAEREYTAGRETILLQFGTPRRASWRTDFYCPVRLVHAGKPQLERVFGIDSVQALMLAFDLAKVLLETSSPGIRWFGSERPGDVGISRRLTTGLGLEFDRRIERLVDEAVRHRGRELERRHKNKKKAARGGTPGGEECSRESGAVLRHVRPAARRPFV